MLPELNFHHIGIITHSIRETSFNYLQSGFSCSQKVYDPIQKVYICFLEKSGHPRIELIEPDSELSSVTNILEKNGVSPYHFCYEVDDLNETINKLIEMNYVLLSDPVKANALKNRLICFLYKKEQGLIELVQQ